MRLPAWEEGGTSEQPEWRDDLSQAGAVPLLRPPDLHSRNPGHIARRKTGVPNHKEYRMQQFTGRGDHGEYLVTIYPATATQPAIAAVTWRADEWDTWLPEVRLASVPVAGVAS